MSDRIVQTIAYIAEAWAGTDRPHLRHVIRGLGRGHPVDPNTLELDGPLPVGEQLRRAGAQFDQVGQIIGIGGIGLAAGCHAITLGRTELSACCAITAQGVALLLGERATVRTSDPLTNRRIVMTISPTGIESVDPREAVATFVPLSEAARREDLSDTFCRFTTYFEGADTAKQFDTRGHEILVLDLEEAYRAARLWVSSVWGADFVARG